MQLARPVIEGLTENQVETLIHCRGYKQFKKSYDAYLRKICQFCDPLDEINKVLYSNETHRIWINPFPIKHTSLHVIIAPIAHILGTDPIIFSREYMAGETDMRAWAYEKFPELQKGGRVKRVGPSLHNVGTVEHDHENLLGTDLRGEVRITLSKPPEDITKGIQRLFIYLQLRGGKPVEELMPDQLELVKGRLD